MKLKPGWYVVGEKSEFYTNRPNALRRFGRNWVLWQSSDQSWVLQADSCAHRSARLSQGKIKNGCVVCPFHGFEFDSSGMCTHAPEINRSAPGLKVQSHRLKLFNDFLWFNHEVDFDSNIPWFEDLPPHFDGTQFQSDWNQHFSRCVENQLDHSHLPFVHERTIGRGLPKDKKVHTEITPQSIRVSLSESISTDSNFFFLFPGLWRLRVSKNMMPMIAFVPIDEAYTRLYLRTYHRFVSIPVLKTIFGKILNFSNRIILNEDKAVVLGQNPNNVLDATNERLFPSDQAIAGYRRYLEQP